MRQIDKKGLSSFALEVCKRRDVLANFVFDMGFSITICHLGNRVLFSQLPVSSESFIPVNFISIFNSFLINL